VKRIRNLDHWLEKATAHATAKSFDVNVLVQARLAPDPFALVRQVQAACDAAKFAAAYLAHRPGCAARTISPRRRFGSLPLKD
jgi:hypothetical protein